MKICILLTTVFSVLHADEPKAVDWVPMLDAKLSQFQTYLSIPPRSVFIKDYTYATNLKDSKPLGVDNDPLNVFQTSKPHDKWLLRISGQIPGFISTHKEYGDFHLRSQFRWGNAKWEPYLKVPRTSGILYRSFGPLLVWPSGVKYQICEGRIGDSYAVGDVSMYGHAKGSVNEAGIKMFTYSPRERLMKMSFCQHGEDYQESLNGEWNTIEIISVGGNSIHLLNGKVVNVSQKIENKKLIKPIVTGVIRLLSAGAECEFQDLEIRTLTAMPEEYEALF